MRAVLFALLALLCATSAHAERPVPTDRPIVIVALDRESALAALDPGERGDKARVGAVLRMFFYGAPKLQTCEFNRAYAVPRNDMLDPATGLCRATSGFAPTPPLAGGCYGLPRSGPKPDLFGRNGVSAGERAVAARLYAPRSHAEVSRNPNPTPGPRFGFNPRAPARFDDRPLTAAGHLLAASPMRDFGEAMYLSTIDVFGYRPLSISSSGAQWAQIGARGAEGYDLSFNMSGATPRIVVIGPLRLVRKPQGWDVEPADRGGEEVAQAISEVTRLPRSDIVFADLKRERAPLCPPLVETGAIAAGILAAAPKGR